MQKAWNLIQHGLRVNSQLFYYSGPLWLIPYLDSLCSSVWVPAQLACETVKTDPTSLSFVPAMISDMVLLLFVLAGLLIMHRRSGATLGVTHPLWKQVRCQITSITSDHRPRWPNCPSGPFSHVLRSIWTLNCLFGLFFHESTFFSGPSPLCTGSVFPPSPWSECMKKLTLTKADLSAYSYVYVPMRADSSSHPAF
jgi:hypothetical protein